MSRASCGAIMASPRAADSSIDRYSVDGRRQPARRLTYVLVLARLNVLTVPRAGGSHRGGVALGVLRRMVMAAPTPWCPSAAADASNLLWPRTCKRVSRFDNPSLLSVMGVPFVQRPTLDEFASRMRVWLVRPVDE
jgi:hypothetical protein